jgi:hypothetical protein
MQKMEYDRQRVLTDKGPVARRLKNITCLRIKARRLSVRVALVISYIFCRPKLFQMHHSHGSICSAVLFTPLADGQWGEAQGTS